MQTQLAFQFFPLISRYILIVLSNYLVFYPPFQTQKVNVVFADTRVHPYIFERVLANMIAEAVFADVFEFLCHFWDILFFNIV